MNDEFSVSSSSSTVLWLSDLFHSSSSSSIASSETSYDENLGQSNNDAPQLAPPGNRLARPSKITQSTRDVSPPFEIISSFSDRKRKLDATTSLLPRDTDGDYQDDSSPWFTTNRDEQQHKGSNIPLKDREWTVLASTSIVHNHTFVGEQQLKLDWHPPSIPQPGTLSTRIPAVRTNAPSHACTLKKSNNSKTVNQYQVEEDFPTLQQLVSKQKLLRTSSTGVGASELFPRTGTGLEVDIHNDQQQHLNFFESQKHIQRGPQQEEDVRSLSQAHCFLALLNSEHFHSTSNDNMDEISLPYLQAGVYLEGMTNLQRALNARHSDSYSSSNHVGDSDSQGTPHAMPLPASVRVGQDVDVGASHMQGLSSFSHASSRVINIPRSNRFDTTADKVERSLRLFQLPTDEDHTAIRPTTAGLRDAQQQQLAAGSSVDEVESNSGSSVDSTTARFKTDTTEEVIKEPREQDILLGRTISSFMHPANQMLRIMVDEYREAYESSCSRAEKTAMTEFIVQMAKNHDVLTKDGEQEFPPGRFLEYKKELQGWIEVDDERARRKVSHLFRAKPRSRENMEDA